MPGRKVVVTDNVFVNVVGVERVVFYGAKSEIG